MLVARRTISIGDHRYAAGEPIDSDGVRLLRAQGPQRIRRYVDAGQLEDVPDNLAVDELAGEVRKLRERVDDLEVRLASHDDVDGEAAVLAERHGERIVDPPTGTGGGDEPSGPAPAFVCETCGDGREYSEHGLKIHRGRMHGAEQED